MRNLSSANGRHESFVFFHLRHDGSGEKALDVNKYLNYHHDPCKLSCKHDGAGFSIFGLIIEERGALHCNQPAKKPINHPPIRNQNPSQHSIILNHHYGGETNFARCNFICDCANILFPSIDINPFITRRIYFHCNPRAS